jgi:cell pole-organizing protein PopZ
MSGAGDQQKPAGGGDPAMDDILASIRRILNEDEAQPAAAPAGPPPAPPRPPAAEPDEALDLTEAMLVQPAPPETPAGPPPVEAVSPVAPAATSPALSADALVAPAVAAATTAAVGQLLRAVAQERSATVHRGGPSIEDVVREELRPLLKEWLDQHLPPLVERLVRAEIERVVGRALP